MLEPQCPSQGVEATEKLRTGPEGVQFFRETSA
jgi:hypothetical protein